MKQEPSIFLLLISSIAKVFKIQDKTLGTPTRNPHSFFGKERLSAFVRASPTLLDWKLYFSETGFHEIS